MAVANTKQAAYPDQLSLTGLRIGSGTIAVLLARAGAAAVRRPQTATWAFIGSRWLKPRTPRHWRAFDLFRRKTKSSPEP